MTCYFLIILQYFIRYYLILCENDLEEDMILLTKKLNGFSTKRFVFSAKLSTTSAAIQRSLHISCNFHESTRSKVVDKDIWKILKLEKKYLESNNQNIQGFY